MPPLSGLVDAAWTLLARGGPVMPWIFGLSVGMWMLIIDRYVYLRWRHPELLRAVTDAWANRADYRSRVARRLRAQHMLDIGFAARRHLPLIRTLIQVLPLLGLLGTVIGLIHTFEAIQLFGGANRRGVAAGVSEALVATLSGLVTALSGLFFSGHLERCARAARADAERLRRE
jgi:biopolymer transport protein ExbB